MAASKKTAVRDHIVLYYDDSWNAGMQTYYTKDEAVKEAKRIAGQGEEDAFVLQVVGRAKVEDEDLSHIATL